MRDRIIVRVSFVVAMALSLQVSAVVAQAHDWKVNDGGQSAYSSSGYYVLEGPSSSWWYHDYHQYVRTQKRYIYYKANWYMPVNDSSYDHVYHLKYKKRDTEHFTARNAWYRRYCCGTLSGRTSSYWVNQNAGTSGSYNIVDWSENFDQNGYVQLVDWTGTGGRYLGMDYFWFDQK